MIGRNRNNREQGPDGPESNDARFALLIAGGLLAFVVFLGINKFARIQDKLDSWTGARENIVKASETLQTLAIGHFRLWRNVDMPRDVNFSRPFLSVFRGEVPTACGLHGNDSPAFYCPREQRIWLSRNLAGAAGSSKEWILQYILAHETGHHVQHLMRDSFEELLRSAELRGMSESERHAFSIRVELQANCYAGVWVRHAEQDLNQPGMGRAVDLYLRRQTPTGAYGSDETRPTYGDHTHGTPTQRADWFTRGYRSGDLLDCDTFASESL